MKKKVIVLGTRIDYERHLDEVGGTSEEYIHGCRVENIQGVIARGVVVLKSFGQIDPDGRYLVELLDTARGRVR